MKLLDLLADPRTPLVLAAAVALARVCYAVISRVVQPFPRTRAAVEAVAALAPDVLRSLMQVVAVFTGRPAPKLDALPGGERPDADIIDAAARELAEAFPGGATSDVIALHLDTHVTNLILRLRRVEESRDAAERRVAELTASEEPGRLRPTVVPGEELARSPDETTATMRETTSRHRIRGAL